MQTRIKEIKDRVDNISGEEWTFNGVLYDPKEKETSAAIVEQIQGHAKYRITVQSYGGKAIIADAEFIANAPSDVKYLLDALQEAREENEQMNEHFDKMESIHTDVDAELNQSQDRERVLREALEQIKEMSEVELLESSWSVCDIALRQNGLLKGV